ncbi:hypothetical protein JOQ06_016538, partial [Pogonophryne albipinna]
MADRRRKRGIGESDSDTNTQETKGPAALSLTKVNTASTGDRPTGNPEHSPKCHSDPHLYVTLTPPQCHSDPHLYVTLTPPQWSHLKLRNTEGTSSQQQPPTCCTHSLLTSHTAAGANFRDDSHH